MTAEKRHTQYVLKLHTGQSFDVIEETTRYWICEGTQFKKTSRQVESVKRRTARKETHDD